MSPDPSVILAPKLKLHTTTRDEGAVIQCIGGLTAENVDALKNHVKSMLPHAKQIVLDLRELTRMDSAGLGAVVGLYISARKANCQFMMVNYNESIKDLLGLTHLLSVFEACAQSGTRIP